MHITFAGAAREVTGSCHVVEVGGKTVLLDCGMFQGRRAQSREKNARLPIPIAQIDAVVLSHAHIDHSGRLPFLVRNGYAGPIYATPATRDLCALMLADSAHIQEKDADFLARHGRDVATPLYGTADAIRTLALMRTVPYAQWFDVVPGVRARFVDAGHILGSASVTVECTEDGTTRRVVFSGDVGRSGLSIIRDPVPPDGADVVLMESTYGNRDHESVSGARVRLGQVVRETAAGGGKLYIPAFAVGRTQELVYDLHALYRDGAIPKVPIYIDSPLAADATTVFEMHPETFDQGETLVRQERDLFRFPLVHYTRDAAESKALNTRRGPMIVIAASGMVESGRILHHLLHGAAEERNTILVVGFMAEHTLGRRIVERRPVLRILGEDVELHARVEILNGYSAHADRTELARWLNAVRATSSALGRVYLVHGEPAAQDAFAAASRARGYDVDCPAPGTRVEL